MTSDFDGFALPPVVLRASASNKWNKHGLDVLPAWVADMDFAIATPIADALHEYQEAGFFGYAVHSLAGEVKEAFGTWWERRYGLAVNQELSVCLTEVVQALHAVTYAFSGPGEGVLVLTPIYPPFLDVVAQQRRCLVEHRMEVINGRYEFDPETLRALIVAERPRILMLCNPHNPVGRVFSVDELRLLGDLAVEFDMVILSDEIHADLVYEPYCHVSIATLSAEIASRTITASSASKSFNLAGLRCAVISFGSADLKERFDAVIPAHLLGMPSVPGLLASLAAWTHGSPWLADCLTHLARNRSLVRETFAKELPWVGCVPVEGTYLQWLDFSALRLGAGEVVSERLRSEARVALNEGPTFGAGLESYARLNFATSEMLLREILDRIVGWARLHRGS